MTNNRKRAGMKETIFFIVISIRTLEGPESRGKIYIGNDRKGAEELFNGLCCQDEAAEDSMLLMELMEDRGGLPVNLKIKSCTLEDLSENCKSIMKYLFMTLNLTPSH